MSSTLTPVNGSHPDYQIPKAPVKKKIKPIQAERVLSPRSERPREIWNKVKTPTPEEMWSPGHTPFPSVSNLEFRKKN